MFNSAKVEQPNKRPLKDNENIPSQKRVRIDDGTVEIVLLLKNQYVGQVIGKGGENITSIRKESGARVQIQTAGKNSYERTASVMGNVEEVSSAIQMIVNIVSEDNPMITLLVDRNNLGPLIGKQGARITQIREETKANVRIGTECLGNSTQKDVRITGDADAVSQAIKAVVGRLAEGKSTVRIPYIPSEVGNYNNSLPAGDRFMPSMFGAGGMTQGMNYQGQRKSANQAPVSLLRIKTTIMVPKDIIGVIIGRGGSNINAVRKQSGAQIKVSSSENDNDDKDSPEREITITGSRESINLACSMIESLASQVR